MGQPAPEYDVVGAIIDFETGEMQTEEEVLTLFQHLVDTGMAWSLQGSYGRAAAEMIRQGLIALPGGEVVGE